MIDLLNEFAKLAPQATTALLNENKGAVAALLRDKKHNIAAVRNATGKIIGFEVIKFAAKKAEDKKPEESKPKAKKTSVFGGKKKEK